MKKFPHHFRAKAVYRSDMRLGEQNALAAEQPVFRVFPQHFIEPSFQPGPHFRCGRFGEGDNEHPVRPGRTLRIRQPFNRPLHQNRRFAGTRCGSYQHRALSGRNSVCLGFSPTDCHRFHPPPHLAAQKPAEPLSSQ